MKQRVTHDVRRTTVLAAPRTIPVPAAAAPARRARVLWLAVADGRGHLMRAQLMRRLLAPSGVDVDIVTTSRDGAAFADSFDSSRPCGVLDSEFGVVFDGQQNLRWGRTAARMIAYVGLPTRCRADLRWIERRAAGAALVVNDSFHPALLLAPLLGHPLRARLVQVYGESLRTAVQGYWGQRGPYASAVAAALAGSRACIEHSFASPDEAAPGTLRLPPLIAAPRRRADEVRAALGVPPGGRLAVVYLNPYFHDPALAAAIEAALAATGHTMHAIGEGFAGRRGWLARDPQLVEAIGAADVFVSAAGMATLNQARTFGVPFVALATAQPEQRRNLAPLRAAADPRCRVVDLGPDLAARLADATLALATRSAAGDPRPDPRLAVARLETRWVEAITHLIEEPT